MPLPAQSLRFSLVFALAVAGVTAAHAQSLEQPGPLDRVFEVVQFGVPRDARFVFCDGEDCAERSIKHLYLPPPPPVSVQEPPVAAPASVERPRELSRAKVPAKKKLVRKKHRKPSVRYECKPVVRGR